MNHYHTQYLSNNLTLVNIDIGDTGSENHHQEFLSDQDTDMEEEIKKSIAGAKGNHFFKSKD